MITAGRCGVRSAAQCVARSKHLSDHSDHPSIHHAMQCNAMQRIPRRSQARLRDQVDRCTEYSTRAGIRVDRIIQEIGKGHTLNGRSGIDQLLDLVFRKKVSMIVVECPDRLARWGMGEVLERFLTWHGVELHVISKGWSRAEFREEVKEDLAGILFEAKRLLGEA